MVDDPFSPKPRLDSILDEEQKRQREQIRTFADFLARLLDSIVPIPGTSIRIGLDPLLGLIPGLGDVIANLIGSTILFLAAKLQVPKIVMVRMALNVSLNTVVGAVPGLGDLFSIWFQSNLRNAELLRRYTGKRTTHVTPGDWRFVIGLLLGTFGVIIGTVVLILWGIRTIWNWGEH